MLRRFVHQLDLSKPEVVAALPRSNAPYWNILEYCRSIGVHKPCRDEADYWVARVRKKDGGYHQCRLGHVSAGNGIGVSYGHALQLARDWFDHPDVANIASRSFPVGTTVQLRYTPADGPFTVGGALHDYVEWKRIAATWSHFTVALSLINCHLVPRLAHTPAEDLTGLDIRKFCVDLLETAPRRGNRPPGPRVAIKDLGEEALRKRKKTLNTVLGILRMALQMAWENGKIDNDRAWRCIRNVPSYDAPRSLALTRDECRRLLAACRPDLRQLVQGALYSGCRSTELARLQVRDVARGVFGIHVNRAKGYRSRHVYLPDEGLSFFLRLCEGKVPQDFVFTSQSGRSWSQTEHRHLFKDAVRSAKLPDEFCFHGLRHTYASQLVQSGASLLAVSRQLGHATIDTVVRTYGHLAPSIQEREVRANFATLDPREEDAVALRRNVLDGIATSLQADTGVPAYLPRPAWPRSNFFKGAMP
jgi:integrase